jgi:hypothetical protein
MYNNRNKYNYTYRTRKISCLSPDTWHLFSGTSFPISLEMLIEVIIFKTDPKWMSLMLFLAGNLFPFITARTDKYFQTLK